MRCPSPAWYAAFASLLGILFTPPIAAQETGRSVNRARVGAVDVALDNGQTLRGQVVTPGGEPMVDVKLSMIRHGETLAQVVTDESGRFQVVMPRGGMYQIVTDRKMTSARVWTAKAAPPGCPKQLVVVNGDVVRGQNGAVPYSQLNPWLIAGVVAVAVAIPVILSNRRSDRGDGS